MTRRRQEETKREDAAAAFVRKLLPQLPADCVRFQDQKLYEKPSHLVLAMMTALPCDRQLSEDQTLFMLRFADVLDKVYDEEQRKPPENRGVYHILLLGQGGSGKTHIVQNLIFPIVHFIWPAEGEEDSMMVVAAKNAQAKNISTDQVAAKTLHAASCMRVQSLSNGNMTAGTAEKRLKTLWNSIRVLIIEEISMVSAMMYNMLDFGAMLGRRVAWHVDPHTYSKVGCAFGRVPIVLHLGDFFQLRPTAQLSLLDDLDAKNADGELKYEAVAPEVQHAQEVFANIPDVFELRGTMRFKSGDPLIDLLQCMRQGKKLPTPLWRKFHGRFAKDAEPGVPDPRFFEDKFRYGYCMSIYWSSLARMLSHRAVLDAKELQVPLVTLQAADECCDLKQDAAFRFLNMTNPNKTGHMHGMFPCHIGMDIRFLAKLDGDAGMVQDTQAKIIDFEFHSLDREAYRQTAPGEMFYPRFLPSGLWVSVKGYSGCPDWEELQEMCRKHVQTDEEACKLAKSFWFLPAVEVKVLFSSTQKHEVRRCGFQVTHAQCLTSTASQGLTLRTGTIVDCARLPELDDDNWWLHLYVMFSRVTSLDDLLLLRPPPREILERGPPESIVTRVAEFQKRAERCRDGALRLREQWDVCVGRR